MPRVFPIQKRQHETGVRWNFGDDIVDVFRAEKPQSPSSISPTIIQVNQDGDHFRAAVDVNSPIFLSAPAANRQRGGEIDEVNVELL